MDFAKLIKAISLPQDVPSTSARRLIELENQVQRLMEAHLATKQPNQVNKSLCHVRSVMVPTTLSTTWKIPSKLLLIMRPRVPTKREASGTLSSLSKTTLVTPIIHHGKVTQTLDTKFICTKDDRDIMFIEIIRKYDDSHKEIPEDEGDTTIEGLEDISSIVDPRLSQVVLGKPFVKISNMTYDPSLGVVKFTDRINKIAYKMPHKIEQYDSLSDLEKEHTKSVYLRNEEDKRRGVEYVMRKILGFYKECIELGPEYSTGVAE
ncbi:hypothetical protein Tco_0920749 [Tanacetum coccineum]